MLKTQSLPNTILEVVENKGTEKPYSGEYDDFGESGTYLCRQCGSPLFRSSSKFHSGCGWPSFDEEVKDAVKRVKDKDQVRTEILCARCGGHLGHVFNGEGFTAKNTRYCVNSLSLDFVADLNIKETEEAIFAAGCFWGVQYYFKQLKGVVKTEVGYTGGQKVNPTYQEVCSHSTGHYEAIRVIYDPSLITYESLAKFFFEIHDATDRYGQGPDQGEQYLSVIFYYNDEQKKIALHLINQLKKLGYAIITRILPVTSFWKAESYHQDYYQKTDKKPYCHRYEKKFK